MRYVLSRLESNEEKEQVNRKSAAAAVLRRLDPRDEDDRQQDAAALARRPRKEDLALNQYEQMIAMDVVAPDDIPVQFDGERLFLHKEQTLIITPLRHRWSWRHYRRTERICNLPSHHARALLPLILITFGTIRRTTLWSSRMRQDNACEGTGT